MHEQTKSSPSGSWAAVLGGVGIGAGLMYLYDPREGRRRRAQARDQLIEAARKSTEMWETTARDMRNRVDGAAAEVRSRFSEDDADDRVVAERVRARLGRVVSHPSSICVDASGGKLTLTGHILASELSALLSQVSGVKGVREIDNQLESHESAEGIPQLQGETMRPGRRFELGQENWSPAARFLSGLAGSTLLLYGFRRRGLAGLTAGAAGAALLTRSAANMELSKLVGLSGTRSVVVIHKTIHIEAPIEEVFSFWTDYENFPKFMSNVLEVKRLGEGRSYWTVAGPGQVPVHWEAEETRRVENELLSWKTVPGSLVKHNGTIRFGPGEDGQGTRVDIRLSYNPGIGLIGHAVATLFGAHPKTKMDEDLSRVKTFLETGKPASDAAAARK